MAIQGGQKILLTGAGFTHNFGTPLADGMWAEIFNQPSVQATPGVRNKLAGDFDFEDVYNAILTGDDEEEKRVITDAVFAAYKKLDGIVMDWHRHDDKFGFDNTYAGLIAKFGLQSGRRFFFTLNQDLFVERSCSRSDYSQLIRPGVKEQIQWSDRSEMIRPLKDEDYTRLPPPDELAVRTDALLLDEGFFYVKLHGSQDWLSYRGKRQMVLGREKEDQIEQEPLLKRYLEVFREVLNEGDRELLVIGYSFRDPHLNGAILDAIRDHGLKVHVLSPQPVRAFFDTLRENRPGVNLSPFSDTDWREHMGVIWNALAGYFPYRLNEMLPGATETRDWRTVLEHFFGEMS